MTLCLESTPKKIALIDESASFRSTISQMKEKEHAQHQLQIRIEKGKKKSIKIFKTGMSSFQSQLLEYAIHAPPACANTQSNG